jgi:precorrin-2 methylase
MAGGRLVVVGSGIRAISQFTLEALAHVDQADRVHYAVADPATEHWLLARRPDARDLSELYGTGKPRADTYVQMAERLLTDVRAGHHVAAVFYGHPGYAVNASHRALAIGRDEGYDAIMLPGISAEDCLFADLGIDPSCAGSQTIEATSLVAERRRLLTDSYVILLQVGFVGVAEFDHANFGRTGKVGVLLDYLEEFYAPDFEFVHYIAAQYPTTAAIIERLTIKALRGGDAAARMRAESTWLFPPAQARAVDPDLARRLGLRANPAPPTADAPYGPSERRAIAELEHHAVPAGYRAARADPRTYELIRDLALNPRLLAEFQRDPDAVVASRPFVVPADVAVICGGAPSQVRALLRRTPAEIAASFVRSALMDPALLEVFCAAAQSRASAEAWLTGAGYGTSLGDVAAAIATVPERRLAAWRGDYRLGDDLLRVEGTRALLNGEPLRGARFSRSTLTWGGRSLSFSLDPAAGLVCHGGEDATAEPGAAAALIALHRAITALADHDG